MAAFSGTYQVDGSKAYDGTITEIVVDADPDVLATPKTSNESASPEGERSKSDSSMDQNDSGSVSGKVTDVACTGQDMRVTISTRERQFTLHARDYSRVEYDVETAFDARNFQPCSQLKGKIAEISYTRAPNGKFDGEIQHVEITP